MMNSHKYKLSFMILQTNLATCSTNFIGIIKQLHYTYNQFNLNFQSILVHVVRFFMIWYLHSQLQIHEM